MFFLNGTSIENGQQGISYNGFALASGGISGYIFRHLIQACVSSSKTE